MRIGLVFWCELPEITQTVSDEQFEVAIYENDSNNLLVKVVWTPENDKEKSLLTKSIFNECDKDSYSWLFIDLGKLKNFIYKRNFV